MNLRIQLVILLCFKIHTCSSETWSSINSPIDSIKFTSYVDYSDNVLYYSSTIMNENQDAITDIYYFDGDTSIKLVGTIQGFVYAITKYNDKIIIGGDFNIISNQEIRDLAVYNVDHFESFVNFDPGYNTLIKCFALFNEKLYIGGSFRSGISLITWDGEGVSYLIDSPVGIVNTITVKNDTLYAGGIFKSVQNMSCEKYCKNGR